LPGAADKSADWSAAQQALDRGGKLVDVYHQIVLFARPDQAQVAEGAMRDVWAARGFELTGDTYNHKCALLQALPMTLSAPFVGDLEKLKRWDRRTSGNTIHMAPLIAEGKGTETPTLLGVGRRGQIQGLDFFDNKLGGKTVSIVGDIGSGKSTLLQEIATAYASKGALVRVIEMGKSFERTAGRVGGQFVAFNRAGHLNVNPFSFVTDPREVMTPDGLELCGGIDDDVAMLQPLLAKMASPNEPLDPTIYATLAVVIKEEYTLKGRTMTVSDVQRRYAKGMLYEGRPVDQRYFDMADMLAPFCEGGVYASYFEGQATLDFSNPFMVFEMQELDTNPHLKAVVQMILLYQITQEMLEERHRQKLFIMDEAKEALAGSGPDDQAQAQFLEKLYLRVRKYNGSAITATQDVAHYFSSTYGASVWNQSAFIILGRQSENSIEAIRKGEAIQLDDNLKRLLGSIGSGSGHFKEWYVHSGLYRGVMRLIINPSTLLLFSNRAEDNVPLDQRIKEAA
jgi:conjugal transfer ATP-binding protein TraC